MNVAEYIKHGLMTTCALALLLKFWFDGYIVYCGYGVWLMWF